MSHSQQYHSKIHRRNEVANRCIPQRCMFSADSRKWKGLLFCSKTIISVQPTVGQGEEESQFLLPPPLLLCLPNVPISLMSQTIFYLFSDLHIKTVREDIQETCPKETSKGQWCTTKYISSICCIQQDVTNALFSLALRGEQEKSSTKGESLEMFIDFWLQNLAVFVSTLHQKKKMEVIWKFKVI